MEKTPISTNPKKTTIRLGSHYIRALSPKIARIWNNTLNAFHVPIEIKFAYSPTLKTSSQIPNYANTKQKDINVVYAVKCSSCSSNSHPREGDSKGWYVGQTTQYLQKRLAQHATQTNSNIFQHIKETKHKFDLLNPIILDKQSDPLKLMISESKFIQKLQPSINNNEGIKLLLL